VVHTADLSMPPVFDDPVARGARPANPARPRRRGGRHQRSPQSGLSEKEIASAAAQPARAGRSADRRRSCRRAPHAHARGIGASKVNEVVHTADLSMPPVFDDPVARGARPANPARPRRRGGRHQRSPQSGLSEKEIASAAAQPARAGRSADRRRSCRRAPHAHARGIGASKVNEVVHTADLSMPPVFDDPVARGARPANPARPRRRGGRHQRSPQSGLKRKRNCVSSRPAGPSGSLRGPTSLMSACPSRARARNRRQQG
jgi:hypothetical protein